MVLFHGKFQLKQMTPTEEYNNLQRSYEAALDNLKCEIALSDKNWTTILHEALLLQLGSPNGGSGHALTAQLFSFDIFLFFHFTPSS